MSYGNFNMRLENALKDSAYAVFERYGISASQAVRMFFAQVSRTGKIPLTLDYGFEPIEHEKNPLTMKAVEEVKNQHTVHYRNFDEFLEELKNERN